MTIMINSYRAVMNKRSLSLLSFITTSRLLAAVLIICFWYLSLAFISTLSILIWFWGYIVCLLMIKSFMTLLYDLRVKWIIIVFFVSNITSLLLFQSNASLIIALISFLLLWAVDLVTHAVKLSIKIIASPWLLIRHCIRSALKKRNRIRNREDS